MSKAKIQRIFKHYGEQSQLIKTQEELKESWSIGNLERVLAAHGYRVQDLDCYKH